MSDGVRETDQGFVLTGAGIDLYRHIATVHGLRMEISMAEKFGFPATACPTRGRALGSAKRILVDANLLKPKQRITRKGALELLEKYLKEQGIELTERSP